MESFVRVTNTAPEILAFPWVKALLSPSRRAEYEEWKKTPDYLGVSDIDIQGRKRIPEAVKAVPFYESVGEGMYFDQWSTDGQGITRKEKVLKWVLGPLFSDKFLADRNSIYKLRSICTAHNITFKKEDTNKDLARKISAKFGKNSKVLTRSQVIDSGMQASYGKREIVQTQANKNGKDNKIVFEGFLEIDEVTPEEAEEELGEIVHEEVTIKSNGIADLSFPELCQLAKKRGIEGAVNMTKTELIKILDEATE